MIPTYAEMDTIILAALVRLRKELGLDQPRLRSGENHRAEMYTPQDTWEDCLCIVHTVLIHAHKNVGEDGRNSIADMCGDLARHF